jgi:hypothetical protein
MYSWLWRSQQKKLGLRRAKKHSSELIAARDELLWQSGGSNAWLDFEKAV